MKKLKEWYTDSWLDLWLNDIGPLHDHSIDIIMNNTWPTGCWEKGYRSAQWYIDCTHFNMWGLGVDD